MPVAGGAGHLHVELEVRRHRVRVFGDGQLEGRKRRLHLAQVVFVAVLRRQAGGLAFQADAQLQQRHHVGHGGHVLGRDAKRAPLGQGQHEGADAVARVHQARGLQARNGLTHHGAAHGKAGHQGRFGGQLVPGLQAAFAHVAGQRVHDLGHQAAGAARPGRRRAFTWGFHGEHGFFLDAAWACSQNSLVVRQPTTDNRSLHLTTVTKPSRTSKPSGDPS